MVSGNTAKRYNQESFSINFEGKKFRLIANSKNGEATSETIFEYSQEGDLVTADYYGGEIRYGKIIGLLDGNNLQMYYQCLTKEDEFKLGSELNL